jgi:DNA-binding SARP family transcriptional activator
MAALAAAALAHDTAVPGAEALSHAALDLLERPSQQSQEPLRRAAAHRLPWVSATAPIGGGPQASNVTHHALPSVVLHCFGGFRLEVGGRMVDSRAIKPRARAVLHLLAIAAGKPVHREAIVDALWPGADVRAGMRNLHVAVSSVRQLLEPGVPRGAASLVVREGDAYRLAISEEATVDLWQFESALTEGHHARSQGDLRRAVAALGGALDAYAGDLLPEDGPADWVVGERERYRLEASAAAQALAEASLVLGDADSAATACERGLAIDRYRDSLWQLLAEARDRTGDQAVAARVRGAYRDVLVELGVG